jgi:protease IV
MRKETLIIFSLLVLFAVSIGLTKRQQQELSSSGAFLSDEQIAVVDIYGPIAFSSGSTMFPSGTEASLKELKSIREDNDVSAVILRINSPGGTVGASQELYDQINKLKAELDIPVIASIGDIGASGAYYAALAADEIFANPGSLVGSIGVIMGSMNFSQLAEKYGVDFTVYKSGKYKDALSGWRESNEDEEELLQALVDNVHHQFVRALVKERALSEEKADVIAQGQVFSGEQALEETLIDHIGSFDDAVSYAAKISGISGQPQLITKSGGGLQDIFQVWGKEFGFKQFFNNTPTLEF